MYGNELRNEHAELTRDWTLLFARHSIRRFFQNGRREFRWRWKYSQPLQDRALVQRLHLTNQSTILHFQAQILNSLFCVGTIIVASTSATRRASNYILSRMPASQAHWARVFNGLLCVGSTVEANMTTRRRTSNSVLPRPSAARAHGARIFTSLLCVRIITTAVSAITRSPWTQREFPRQILRFRLVARWHESVGKGSHGVFEAGEGHAGSTLARIG
jgi:hypothetical protein